MWPPGHPCCSALTSAGLGTASALPGPACGGSILHSHNARGTSSVVGRWGTLGTGVSRLPADIQASGSPQMACEGPPSMEQFCSVSTGDLLSLRATPLVRRSGRERLSSVWRLCLGPVPRLSCCRWLGWVPPMIHPDLGGCCPFLLNLAHKPMLVPCIVRVFKRARCLNGSSPGQLLPQVVAGIGAQAAGRLCTGVSSCLHLRAPPYPGCSHLALA